MLMREWMAQRRSSRREGEEDGEKVISHTFGPTVDSYTSRRCFDPFRSIFLLRRTRPFLDIEISYRSAEI